VNPKTKSEEAAGRATAWLVVTLLALGWVATPGRACTTIVLRDGQKVVVGSNLDYVVTDGLVFVNQRGMTRRSVGDPAVHDAMWVSRFGNVTFNLAARDLPSFGINEAGLVIGSMELLGTRYPEADDRDSLDNASWVQYQLDTSANVRDVIASDFDVRISDSAPNHFLVADRSGDAATIEFLDGRMVVHTGDQLPVAALTNSTYEDSLRSIEGKTFGSWLWWPWGLPWGLPWGRASLDRFEVAAGRVQEFKSSPRKDAVDYAFDTLRSVSQGGATPTRWTVVYELTPERTLVSFRTYKSSEIKTIDLTRLDFSCSRSAEWLDMHQEEGGDATSGFHPYSYERNLELVRTSFRQIDFLKDLPDSVLQDVARLSHSSTCVEE
jgi:penicillin V acylase-like amidase (Ntn superfamily)